MRATLYLYHMDGEVVTEEHEVPVRFARGDTVMLYGNMYEVESPHFIMEIVDTGAYYPRTNEPIRMPRWRATYHLYRSWNPS